MLLFFYKIKTGLTSPVLHSFLPLTLGQVAAYSLRHANNFQLPLSERSLIHNSSFYNAPLLWCSYQNISNYLLVLQHLKTALPTFTKARNAIFGTYTGQIYQLFHYALCFALVKALQKSISQCNCGSTYRLNTFSCSAICAFTIATYFS